MNTDEPRTPDAAGGEPRDGVHPHGQTPPRRSFFDWVRSLGLVRSDNHWVGGVAAGIAQRISVDPVIIRGAFVVLTIVGLPMVGIYAALWLLLPDARGRIHLQDIVHGEFHAPGVVSLVITVIGLLSLPSQRFFGHGWLWGQDASGVSGPFFIQGVIGVIVGVLWFLAVTAAVIWFIVWLVRQSKRSGGEGSNDGHAPTDTRPFVTHPHAYAAQDAPDRHPESQTPGADADSDAAPASAATASLTAPAPSTPTASGSTTPPWNPAAYQRPPLPPRPPRTPRAGAPLTLTFLGLSFLSFGIIALLHNQGVSNFGGLWLLVALAVASMVLGLGVVVSGAIGRRSGMLGFFAVLSLIPVLIAAVVPNEGSGPWAGAATWRPSTAAVAEQGYSIGVGAGTLDLRSLDLVSGQSVTIPVRLGAGEIRIDVPEDVSLTVDATGPNVNMSGSQVGTSTVVPNIVTHPRDSGERWRQHMTMTANPGQPKQVTVTITASFAVNVDAFFFAGQATSVPSPTPKPSPSLVPLPSPLPSN